MQVAILDSGIEIGHPLVGEVQAAYAVSVDADGNAEITEDEQGDRCGHGTAARESSAHARLRGSSVSVCSVRDTPAADG